MNYRLLEEGKAIRDPVWGYIHVPEEMMALIDAEDFQRLRSISQLGHVTLVYPGARHSRFEHSLGVFHLAKRFLLQLVRSDPPLKIDEEDTKVFLAAALLHDIGHRPFSHILEEMRTSFASHEERGRRIIMDEKGGVYPVLKHGLGIDPARVANVIDYRNRHVDIPERELTLANILSGTLDPDKIDYLLRDAMFCGVPFGESVNKDRLVNSITFDPIRRCPAITHKGVSAVEALIFTSYLMYRNVYWHHAVRSANAMFKRGVQDIMRHPECRLMEEDFERITEEELFRMLREEAERLGETGAAKLLDGVLKRRLYKVARVFYPHERTPALMRHFRDLYTHLDRRRDIEIELCRAFEERAGRALKGHEILVDIPGFTKNLEIELKVYFGSHIPTGREDPLSFDDPEVSGLKPYLIENFEAQAKIFRVFCVDDDDLRAAIKTDVMQHIG